jgi:hypothetical protein
MEPPSEPPEPCDAIGDQLYSQFVKHIRTHQYPKLLWREFHKGKSPWMQREILLRFQAAAASEETLKAFWEDFSLTASNADPGIMRERRKRAWEEKERERLNRERMEREDKTERSRSPPRATGSTITEE